MWHVSFASTSDLIGISLSKSCQTMIRNNVTSQCPSYLELVQLDSSLSVQGLFTYDDKGFYHRENSQYRNSWRLYDTDPTPRIIVDPVHGMADKIQMIEIQPSLETYLDPKDTVIINNTRTVYHQRFVDDCHNAVISAEMWKELIADTIYYMRNGCAEKYTAFDPIEKIYMPPSYQDISTSRKYLHDQWIDFVQHNCIYKFRSCP